jgi:hypothetical protein
MTGLFRGKAPVGAERPHMVGSVVTVAPQAHPAFPVTHLSVKEVWRYSNRIKKLADLAELPKNLSKKQLSHAAQLYLNTALLRGP